MHLKAFPSTLTEMKYMIVVACTKKNLDTCFLNSLLLLLLFMLSLLFSPPNLHSITRTQLEDNTLTWHNRSDTANTVGLDLIMKIRVLHLLPLLFLFVVWTTLQSFSYSILSYSLVTLCVYIYLIILNSTIINRNYRLSTEEKTE